MSVIFSPWNLFLALFRAVDILSPQQSCHPAAPFLSFLGFLDPRFLKRIFLSVEKAHFWVVFFKKGSGEMNLIWPLITLKWFYSTFIFDWWFVWLKVSKWNIISLNWIEHYFFYCHLAFRGSNIILVLNLLHTYFFPFGKFLIYIPCPRMLQFCYNFL